MSNNELTRGEFCDYIQAFNAKDLEKQHAFYHDKVELIIPDPTIGTLEGSSGIREHYKSVHALANETVIPILVMTEPGKVFFIMEAYFQYLVDTDKAVHEHKVKQGDVLKVTVWAFYTLEDRKMKKITCNLFDHQLLGQVNVKTCIRDSESRAEPDLRLYNY